MWVVDLKFLKKKENYSLNKTPLALIEVEILTWQWRQSYFKSLDHLAKTDCNEKQETCLQKSTELSLQKKYFYILYLLLLYVFC